MRIQGHSSFAMSGADRWFFRRHLSRHCFFRRSLVLASCGAAWWTLGLGHLTFLVTGHPVALQVAVAPVTVVVRATSDEDSSMSTVEEKNDWSLLIGCTDHYIWKDEHSFVSTVADAGEWTVDLETIRSAYHEARKTRVAKVFDAPLYIVKAYVKELMNYGIMAKAEKAEEAEEAESSDQSSAKPAWKRRDWRELTPDQKDEAGGRDGAAAQMYLGNMCVRIKCSDLGVFDRSRSGMGRFRAYVELAADNAKTVAPDEEVLNWCYSRIVGPEGSAVVLDGMKEEWAQKAVDQFEKAGFIAEVEEKVKS